MPVCRASPRRESLEERERKMKIGEAPGKSLDGANARNWKKNDLTGDGEDGGVFG